MYVMTSESNTQTVGYGGWSMEPCCRNVGNRIIIELSDATRKWLKVRLTNLDETPFFSAHPACPAWWTINIIVYVLRWRDR